MPDKEQLKKEIMNVVRDEKNRFQKALENYKLLDDPTEEEYANLNAEWIASLERIKAKYEQNNGQDSLFLRNTVTPLLKMLEDIKGEQADKEAKEQANNPLNYKPRPLKDDQERVYVVMYQANGGDISQWVLQLLSLQKLLATRPIYEDENDARQACKGAVDSMSKGYVSLIVNKNAIMHDELAQKRKDHAGRALVLLKDTAIDEGGEIETLTLGNERYRWLSNQLLPMFA